MIEFTPEQKAQLEGFIEDSDDRSFWMIPPGYSTDCLNCGHIDFDHHRKGGCKPDCPCTALERKPF